MSDFGLIGSSLLGGALSLFGNKQYNDAQRDLAQQANEQQYRMFMQSQQFNRQERLDAQDYNRSLLEEQMRYNSPLAQAQRLSAAGLNPANIMGNDAGNLQSVPHSSPSSSPSAPSVQIPNQVPLVNSADINNIASSVSSLLNTREDVKGKQISNEFARQREIANIDKTLAEKYKLLEDKNVSHSQRLKIQADIDESEARREMLYVQIRRENKAAEYDDQLFSGMVQQYNDKHNESVLTQDSQRMANEIVQKFGLKMKEQEYYQLCLASKHIIAETGLLLSQKNLTNKQAKLVIQDTTNKYLQNVGLYKDNQVKDYINWTLVESYEQNLKQQKQDYNNPFKYVGGFFSGVAANAIRLFK